MYLLAFLAHVNVSMSLLSVVSRLNDQNGSLDGGLETADESSHKKTEAVDCCFRISTITLGRDSVLILVA